MSRSEQINDLRTDSYLSLKKARPEDASLPAFEPAADLLPEELLYILDELLNLEVRRVFLGKSCARPIAHRRLRSLVQVNFYDGHPLACTLFTCRYLRPEAMAAVAWAPSNAADGGALRRVVLRAMLLGVLKSAEIIWQDLCEGLVYQVSHLGFL